MIRTTRFKGVKLSKVKCIIDPAMLDIAAVSTDGRRSVYWEGGGGKGRKKKAVTRKKERVKDGEERIPHLDVPCLLTVQYSTVLYRRRGRTFALQQQNGERGP